MTESETPAPSAEVEETAAAADAAVATAVESPATGEPGPEAEPADSDRLAEALERLDDRLEESQRLLARQSEIATALHAENQRLKAGELLRAQLPLVRDMIRVQDLLGQMLDAAVESTAASDLELARDSILDALARNGIEAAQIASGDAFDARLQRIVGVVAVDDPAADRTVAEVLKVGFTWDEATTIRAADVRVYKHAPVSQPEPEPPGEPGSDADPAPAAQAAAAEAQP